MVARPTGHSTRLTPRSCLFTSACISLQRAMQKLLWECRSRHSPPACLSAWTRNDQKRCYLKRSSCSRARCTCLPTSRAHRPPEFLSCITTLEVVVPDVRASQHVFDTVERFLVEARRLKDCQARRAQDHGESSEDGAQAAALKREYDSLVGGLARLRNRSIKSRIRQLVLENWPRESGNEDATQISREACQLYDLRSELVHNGVRDPEQISSGINRLNQIVPQILLQMFREIAQLA